MNPLLGAVTILASVALGAIGACILTGRRKPPVPGPAQDPPPARQLETQPLPPAPGLSYEDVLHLVLWADEMRNRL